MNQVNLHERAVSYGYAVAGGSLERGYIQDAYKKGANDQREIDIQRACDWLDEYFDRCFGVSAYQFCESAKIEITKAMKGE